MRKGQCKKRQIPSDRKYNLLTAAKMINKIMKNGKKSIAEKIFYSALESGAKEVSMEPMEFFNKVLENVGPKKHITLKRFGGNTYSIPKELEVNKRPYKAINILVKCMRREAFAKGKKTYLVLKDLFVNSYNNTGSAITAKEEIHKIAAQNAAFSHLGS